MLVKFKQAVHLKGANGHGKDYPRGTHEVPEDHLQDPHFHKLMKAGLVEDGEKAQVVSSLSAQDRQKQLAEYLASRNRQASIAPSKEHPPSVAAPAALPKGEPELAPAEDDLEEEALEEDFTKPGDDEDSEDLSPAEQEESDEEGGHGFEGASEEAKAEKKKKKKKSKHSSKR